MAQAQQPIICLVHGAWGGPDLYAPLTDRLRARGFDVLTPRNPTLGADAAARSIADDARAIQELAAPLFAQGRELVLLGHSFGGITSAHAAAGHTVAERAAAGAPGGFRAMIPFGAFIVPKGVDVTTFLGGGIPDFVNIGPPYKGDQLCSLNSAMQPIFYSDIAPEDAQRLFEMAEPMAQNVFETPMTVDVASLPLAKHYILLEADLATPTVLQEKMVATVPDMKVVRLAGGHSPYFTQPDKLTEMVCDAVKEVMGN